ncbi:type I-F CRISPR-associated protein Csy2 [Acinetobacter rathckeae]|uniref:type I-F CRISPR-associated protein Csy2 n=1 Tax=Acinetobacter rathckeae TaxID=2605272 RepID=UPI0018A251B0|nr:type I-F CRISPR-associated protein Csy2 [Acinetobacter rathckeae]MBF7689127.1 type I-F CRISPR-associated protein Csy2 [Acinetobacter rathckeae]MBF7695431.1 type I-F CRISPR-associated protein Csy2 [Acinetobacter rathckeae]
MSEFLVIPYLKVQAANFQSSGLVMGGAPLMAAAMFSHHLARQVNAKDCGFHYVHHHIQRLGGEAYGRFTPAQRRGSVFIGKSDYSSKNKYALSLQPTASCHLLLSLVIEFKKKVLGGVNLNTFVSAIKRSKFAGGHILEFGQVQSHEQIEDALAQVGSGFLVHDRHDLLSKYQQAYQVNRLQAFTQLLATKTPHKDSDTPALALLPNESVAWLSATTLGYALLEQATDERSGIRHADHQENTQHAYAEPLTGLIQYQSLNHVLHEVSLKDSTYPDDYLEQSQWQHQWLNDDIFLLQQQKNH